MYYFGHSEKEKELSFELLCRKNTDKLTPDMLDWYLPFRNDPSVYVFNVWEDKEIKFTACYAPPQLTRNHHHPFSYVFREEYNEMDLSQVGEIFNLASDLKSPSKFIQSIESFTESVWNEHISFGANHIFITVNPKHVFFYENVLKTQTVANLKNHPILNLPTRLMLLEFFNDTD